MILYIYFMRRIIKQYAMKHQSEVKVAIVTFKYT